MTSNLSAPHKVRQSAGRPKDAHKRQSIVESARSLFLEKGYELTSVEAVAKMAQVSKLTIYSHFANKADLFKEVIRQGCDRQAAPDNFADYAQVSVEQALMQLGRTLTTLVFSPDALRLIRIIQAEAVQHPEIVSIFYEAGPQRVKSAFGELLQIWVADGTLKIPDITLATEQFFSLVKGEKHIKAILHLDVERGEAEMEQHLTAAVRLFLAGYAIPQAGAVA